MRPRRNPEDLLAAVAIAACSALSACTGPTTPEAPPPPSPPSAVSPPTTTGEPPRTTALAVEAPHPARSVAGSDGSTHLEYDLVVTNGFTADATLTALVVRDEGGRELLSLRGKELGSATFKLLSPEPTATVRASATVAVVVDVPLADRAGGEAPAAVHNELSYVVPDDAPFRTIVGATTVRGPRVEVDPAAPTVVKAPLRGAGWLNFNGCCAPAAPHRNVLLPSDGTFRAFELFAIDWVRLEGNTVFDGDGSTLTDHHAYGAEVHAATAGEVVDVRDDMPDAPVNQSMTGNPTVEEPADYPGNHVTVRFDTDRYVMYGHLQRGSTRVQVGDQVSEGDVLGLLGSTGNSSAPHLHFSVQDGPDALTSDSLPFVIEAYELTGTASLAQHPVTIDPAAAPQANTYPLAFTIADFGR